MILTFLYHLYFGSVQARIIDIIDFSASETAINFNSISDAKMFNGSTIASNWNYSGLGNTG
jgi:hypothetical protein